MSPFRFLIAGLLLVTLIGTAQAQSLQEVFLKGNIAYGNGDYREAERFYRQVLQEARSPEIHYNLGNALAQQGQWSEAAFHYMKAYSLNPNMESARDNLRLAANRMGLESDYPDLAWPARWFSGREYTTFAAIFFWGALIFLFHGDFIRYRIPFSKALGTVCILVTLVSIAGAIQHKLFRDWAIVSSSVVSLRVAPTESSPGESVLIKGDPVRILGEQKGFFHVITSSGSEGFILPEEAYQLGKD
ncbi:MAG: tetratricopeptide repeat protein [Opitutales bacterium]|jgi:hypothetical protein